jgi:D-alanyl-D-alanine carboxypeptidase
MPLTTKVRTTAARRTRWAVLVLLAALAAAVIGAVAGSQAGSAAFPSSATRLDLEHGGGAGPAQPNGVTVDDGVVHGDVTVFDDTVPAVANLDPDLLTALRRAAEAAAGHGVAFTVTSGWRSAEYQDQLLREAIDRYGSEEEAARWVATPDTSAHVSGKAVDVGPAEARRWLADHGAGYGLCQVYRNEPWHYELRPAAIDGGCPRMYDDPTQDPRMQP